MQNQWDANEPRPRLFLTGGSGYVGRNLIRHFIADGFEVVALARSERSLQVVKALGAVPFATLAFEVTLDTTKARDQLAYDPVITMDEGMSELKAKYLEGSMRNCSDVN